MEFFEAVSRRRSVRSYTSQSVPESAIEKAIDSAILAPNSSNMQTMKICWVRDAVIKEKMHEICLSQSAVKTAQEILVFVADVSLWKRNSKILHEHFQGDQRMHNYYSWVIPILYGWSILAPIKWLTFNLGGIFRPMPRRPWSPRDVDEVAIKSTALACENFMLAMSAQGLDTCPLEGFDERRVKSLLKLTWRARVVMVITAGFRDEKGIWGDQFRIPKELIVEKI